MPPKARVCIAQLIIDLGPFHTQSRPNASNCDMGEMRFKHVSLYVSIISIDTKGIILFHNYKFISRVSFTNVLLKFY